jgi:hypothetical protein
LSSRDVSTLFIVEVGNRPSAVAIDLHDLFKKLVVRVLHDAGIGVGIGAMLADHDHSVHRQLACAPGQRFRNGGIDLHGGMAICALLRKISLAALVDVQRHHIHCRMVKGAGPSIAIQKPIDDMLRVKHPLVRRDDSRELGTVGQDDLLTCG